MKRLWDVRKKASLSDMAGHKTWFLSAILSVIVLFSNVLPTFAIPIRVRVEDLVAGTGIVVTDNGPGDLVPVAGTVVTAVSPSAAFLVALSIGTSSPPNPLDPNQLGELELSGTVISAGAGTIRMTLENADYGGPNHNLPLLGTVSGTLTPGTSITLNSWANPANLVPTLGPDTFPPGALPAIPDLPPAGSVAAFGPAGVTFAVPGLFGATGGAAFNKAGPYSLFASATITFTGPGQVVTFTDTQSVVPEPSTIALVGIGLVGLAIVCRRRKK